MKLSFDYNSQSFPIDLMPTGKFYRATMGETPRQAQGKSAEVEILRAKDGQLELLIDGERVMAYVSVDGAKRWVTINGRTFVLTRSSGAGRKSAGGDHASELTAPMPGQVRSVNVEDGDVVAKGQTLLVVEAMKMEIRIQAQRDGIVKRIFVKQGQTVEREQVLIEIE